MSQSQGFGEQAPPPQFSVPSSRVDPTAPTPGLIPPEYGSSSSVVPQAATPDSAWAVPQPVTLPQPAPPTYPQPGAMPYGAAYPPPGASYGYGPTPYPMGTYAALGATQSNGVGTTALVTGILSFVVCPFILSIVAVICGIVSVQAASQGRATNRGQGVAGIVLGAASLLIYGAWVAFSFAL